MDYMGISFLKYTQSHILGTKQDNIRGMGLLIAGSPSYGGPSLLPEHNSVPERRASGLRVGDSKLFFGYGMFKNPKS